MSSSPPVTPAAAADPAAPATHDPLYMILKTTGLTRHLIGYRSVTWVPFTGSSAVLPAYPDSFRFSVDEVADVAQSLHIHAEDIYIYAGSVFSFSARN